MNGKYRLKYYGIIGTWVFSEFNSKGMKFRTSPFVSFWVELRINYSTFFFSSRSIPLDPRRAFQFPLIQYRLIKISTIPHKTTQMKITYWFPPDWLSLYFRWLYFSSYAFFFLFKISIRRSLTLYRYDVDGCGWLLSMRVSCVCVLLIIYRSVLYNQYSIYDKVSKNLSVFVEVPFPPNERTNSKEKN